MITMAACLCCLLFTSSCNLSNRDKDTVVKVNDEFSIDLFEVLKDSRDLQFVVTTAEEQPCINNKIDFALHRKSGKILLDLIEILPASDCEHGPARISTAASIGHLIPGTYATQINLKNTIFNEGILQVTPDAIKLSMSTHNGFELVRRELRRIPDRLVWGYVAHNNQQLAPTADAFLAELNTLTEPQTLPKGYYSYFTINNDKVAVMSQTPPFPFFKTFYRLSNWNINELKDLLQNYRTEYGEQLEIKLYTWNGQVL